MRQEKQLLLDEMKEKIEGSDSFVITRHHGLKALQADEFRGAVAEDGGEFEVVRKRVFLKALEAAGVDGYSRKMLEGSIGVVFAGEDAVAATKTVYKYQKDTKAIEVIGGRFDGKAVSSDEVKALSELPSKPELQAQFLGLLQAPMVQTVGVMQTLLTSVLHCLENKRAKDAGEE